MRLFQGGSGCYVNQRKIQDPRDEESVNAAPGTCSVLDVENTKWLSGRRIPGRRNGDGQGTLLEIVQQGVILSLNVLDNDGIRSRNYLTVALHGTL